MGHVGNLKVATKIKKKKNERTDLLKCVLE